MNTIPPRVRTFILAGLAVLALVILSASLNSLKLSPGIPYAFPNMAPELYNPQIPNSTVRMLVAILRIMMIFVWIGLPFYIILLIISKEERKRFLRNLVITIPMLMLLYIITRNRVAQNAAEPINLNPRLSGVPSFGDSGDSQVPPPVFTQPPTWVTTLTTIGIALGITLFVLALFYIVWRRSRNQVYFNDPLKMVENEARAALDAIAAGGDLRNTILRAYSQMVETLRKYRSIHRDQDMTPREFELFLENYGIPRDPVHQLTRLFEEVRYGTLNPGRAEEVTAITSLSAIVSACQRAAERQGK